MLAKLMALHRQILFSLAAIAEAILMRTSVGQVPSLNRVASQVAVHVNIYTDVVCAVGHCLVLF